MAMNEQSTESPFPEYMDAQRSHRARTHRGRRSRGKGPMTHNEHHAEAKKHMEAAIKASPASAHAHLFRALSSLKKCG